MWPALSWFLIRRWTCVSCRDSAELDPRHLRAGPRGPSPGTGVPGHGFVSDKEGTKAAARVQKPKKLSALPRER